MPDILFRFEAQFTGIVPVGVVPNGVRLDLSSEGEVSEGLLAGSVIRGISHLLMRPDGVSVIDARKTITRDNLHVAVSVGGYVLPPPELQLPPPEVFLSPDFDWPDVAMPITGYAVFQTGAAPWQGLNRTVAVFTGSANVGTGQLLVEARETTAVMPGG